MTLQEQYTARKKEKREAFFGKSYFYITVSDGFKQVGVMQGLGGDVWFVGYFRDNGARKSLKVKKLWSTTHAADLQSRFEAWAKAKGLREVLV